MKPGDSIEIPVKYREILGKPDLGTRIYRAYGSDMEYRKWFKAVNMLADGEVATPGSVPMYCHISRAALHKRMKSGGLTAFCFKFKGFESYFYGDKERELVQKQYFMLFPIKELLEWEKEIQSRLRKNGIPTKKIVKSAGGKRTMQRKETISEKMINSKAQLD